jgi:hypothetical protein
MISRVHIISGTAIGNTAAVSADSIWADGVGRRDGHMARRRTASAGMEKNGVGQHGKTVGSFGIERFTARLPGQRRPRSDSGRNRFSQRSGRVSVAQDRRFPENRAPSPSNLFPWPTAAVERHSCLPLTASGVRRAIV